MRRPLARRIARRLTYANVIATIALMLSLAGTSYAAIMITGGNIVNGSVTGVDVADGSLTSSDVRDRTVTMRDLAFATVASLQGSDGADGAAGAAGAAGPAGPAGAVGPQGPAGTAAVPGDQGIQGIPGTAIADIDELVGIACSSGPLDGAVTVTYTGPAISIKCSFTCGAQPPLPSFTTAQACTPDTGEWEVQTCSSFYADVNLDRSDGCEVYLMTNPLHCGSVGNNVHQLANSSGNSCNSGSPVLGSCSAGFANADASAATGCETNLMTNVAHCGSVGNPVPSRPNASSACVGGQPSYTCDADYSNTNGVWSDGCEEYTP